MRKRGLDDLEIPDLRGRRALVRVDYNVPLDDRNDVADPSRITATFPTLSRLIEAGARAVLLSHLGRPGGEPDDALSLAPVARALERGLERPVPFIGPPDGDAALEATRAADPGTVMLAENVRFLPGETENDPDLAGRMARLGDLFVNDAFGASHRAHASTVGVARLLRPAVAGLLVKAETEALDALRDPPERPFVAVFGGAKISDKISLLRGMLQRADRVLVGGAMANTLLAASGHDTGRSLVEEDALEAAASLLEAGGDAVVLPEDVVVAPDPDRPGEARTAAVGEIGGDETALDVGPRSRERFAREVEDARTLFWNGPMGLFEREAFAEGTRAVARAAARASGRGAFTVVGGGDTARAVREAGVADAVSHVSTGGGAALQYLDTGSLPAVDVLEDA